MGMDLRSQLTETDAGERAGWIAGLGLAEASTTFQAEDQVARVERTAAMWPMTIFAQLLTLTLALTAAWSLQAQNFGTDAPVYAAAVLGLNLIALLAIRSKRIRRLPPHHVIRAIVPVAGMMSIGIALLGWELIAFGSLPIVTLCIISLAVTFLIMLTALMPVQAAALAFVAAAIVTGTVQSGQYQVMVVGIVVFTAFWIATLINMRLDTTQSHVRERNESKARRANRLLEQFEANGNGWFWETDRSGRIVYVSPKLFEALGREAKDVIGKPFTSLIRFEGGAQDGERALGFHLSTRSSFNDVTVRADVQGEELWWAISGRPIVDQIGQFRGYAGSGTDLTEKRRSEAEANRLARYDSLTGLANRKEMQMALEKALDAKEDGSAEVALFLLDLDRFKAVNDTMGHPVGDELLKQVSKRLFRVVGSKGMVGRLGGDEFKVVLPDMSKQGPLDDLAAQIISDLSQPYMIDGITLSIGCSIGIAVAPTDGATSEELVRNSDLALYVAKADGRGVHRFYQREMHAGAKQRKRTEDDLRVAMSNDELHIAYQPQVSTTTEKIVGYESLIRWTHPSQGAISPEDFIPVAEDVRLIEQIGEWILRKSCMDAAQWPGNARVAVNVSPIQFVNPNFPKVVASALANAQLAPERLELELTESVFLDEGHDTNTMFKTLKRIGVRLALDDFGTGYSALGYLKTAPFDKIKIDQSFIRGAAVVGNRNAAIIKAIVSLAESLYMETTAEGVELKDEIELVKQLGCSHIQGYVYGKPMPHEEVLKQLSGGKGVATAEGHRASRSPRRSLFRSATVDIDGAKNKALIRNISSTGAMVEGIGDIKAGTDILIEILEGQMFKSTVRWSDKERMGIEFARNFDLERLGESPSKIAKPAARRASAA
ncbi:diguanylate cyclase/phosphodiesterase with PAS/PAC sensor(s) [Parasphingopyxis lamellibrachiae]|uniref:Diguanylate cyclase/phosphodiesterase with PAS/PAC sensor(S) n=2 Tax=Parasphingopyxis lamellibrachiae TaxID=680125 RepID=A0A3D9FGQ2_9SPHN|nr:diguanylate cyclase/phosphodiesterase with PAS/PAC sensor(s) [Parasphingopyxis lamellibrachiae]